VAKQSPTIKRFPRFHTGKQVSALARFWQTKAQLEVQAHAETKSLTFTYRYLAPVNMPPNCDGLYDPLFGVYRDELEKRLRDTLLEMVSGRLAVTYIDKLHHRAIQNGMSGWLFDLYRRTSALTEMEKDQIKEFAELSPKRSGPDAQLALLVRERVLNVCSSVKLLRKNINPSLLELADEIALLKEIENSGLRLEAVREAIQGLLQDRDVKSVKVLFGDHFTPTVIARSIVQAELALDKRNSLKISVRKFVRTANQLLGALHEPRRTKVANSDKKA
jgi:hypothetical protein